MPSSCKIVNYSIDDFKTFLNNKNLPKVQQNSLYTFFGHELVDELSCGHLPIGPLVWRRWIKLSSSPSASILMFHEQSALLSFSYFKC